MKRMLIVAMLLCSSQALADSANPAPAKSSAADAAELMVRTQLVNPLAKKDDKRSKFSRARLPPQTRRVRVIDKQPLRDARGRSFIRFAVDERHGVLDDEWNKNAITGCAYVDRKEVFVKKGDGYRPADFLLGKYRKAAAGSTCKASTSLARK